MGAAYSRDLRDRILAAYGGGMATKPIAKLFGVSPAWARRVKQRRREFGETGPRPAGGVTIVKIDLQRLAELVRQQPDATGPELRQRLGASCSDSAIYMALGRPGLTYKKKKRSTRSSRRGPTSPTKRSYGVEPCAKEADALAELILAYLRCRTAADERRRAILLNFGATG